MASGLRQALNFWSEGFVQVWAFQKEKSGLLAPYNLRSNGEFDFAATYEAFQGQ